MPSAKTAGLVGGESRVAAPFVVENPLLVSRPPRTGFSITSDALDTPEDLPKEGARQVGSPEGGDRMTGSARSRSDGGIVRPRALAVLRLITNSNFVGDPKK